MTRLKRVYGYECIGQVVFLTKLSSLNLMN